MEKKRNKETSQKGIGAIGGILGGLVELVDRLGELAAKGEELSRTGNIRWEGGNRNVRGVYGFSVRTGIGGEGVKVEPFGNIHEEEESGVSVVQEVREPIADVFEEEDHVLIVAEMPGVEREDIHVEVEGDVLKLSAESSDRRYRKEIQLPGGTNRESISVSCKNGIVEIKCQR